MKNNIILKRAIIGLIFCAIVLIAVSIIEVKNKERMNKVHEEQASNIYNTNNGLKYNINEITSENTSIKDLKNGQDDGKNKNEIN